MTTYRFYIQPSPSLTNKRDGRLSIEEARALLAGHEFVRSAWEALDAKDPRRDGAFAAVRSSSEYLGLRGVMFDAWVVDDGRFATAARQAGVPVHVIEVGEQLGVQDDPTVG